LKQQIQEKAKTGLDIWKALEYAEASDNETLTHQVSSCLWIKVDEILGLLEDYATVPKQQLLKRRKKLLKWKPRTDRGWVVREELLIFIGWLLGDDAKRVYMEANAEISQVKTVLGLEPEKK
jgi:hypothetical protein